MLWTKVLKIYCAFFFWLIAQFYSLNLTLFDFDHNIDKCRPSEANYLLFFCLKLQKMQYLHCVMKFQSRKLGCALTWYKNAILQLQNCIALQLNQKVHCESSTVLQKFKKLNCTFGAALLVVEKIIAFVALHF